MVYILGGWQSDFKRNWVREGMEIADGFAETLTGGLEATELEPGDIDVGHVGNFVGDLFAGQGMLGGFFALSDQRFDGMPASRHEGACASGSLAILAAMADIESGRYGTAAVLGLELMRNVPGQTAAEHLGAAAWAGHEYQDARYVWPRAFSDLTEEYDRRYGINEAHLRRIAQINFANARLNPNAQTREYVFPDAAFANDDEANPVIEGRVRKTDCGQVTDGGAMVVLASAERAADYARRRGIALESLPRIKGWGHRNAPISYARKIAASADEAYVFPQVKRAIDEARARAGMSLDSIDAVETHDCFSMTEYMAIDHLGLTAPGEAWKAIEAGDIEIGGRLPINPSGGLIGCGHPVGATGVRMALDAFKQTTGTAGAYQVEGASTVQTLNIGGSTTTTVSLVIGV
ncbi:acetyl-CoA acetyltransferase [Brevundimonas sp. BAL450]|uniref:3-ketoacyl-CoA thiolase n=2 Tax=Brevundimonas TaxID=41275 RepID=A0A8E0KKG5_9CAUL|nr:MULTISPECIES: acetyl-CoA acetyltransferase [Brevundimonas]MBG7614057.1 acetyl-CoA acetyltransferase [Brevundimonas sp. BAL450]GAD58744.1 3-ketoacyl-CoA thiolase [Brevundimonas abyssalis TAR-001]